MTSFNPPTFFHTRLIAAILLGLTALAAPVYAGSGEVAWEAANAQITAALERGDAAGARSAAENAAQIAEREFGKDHMKTAVALRKLADAQMLAGDFAKASDALERAALLSVSNLGAKHSHAADLWIESGRASRAAKDWPKAVEAFQRALDIQKKYFGKRHTVVATTLRELASVYRESNDWVAAHKNYAEAAEILLEVLEPAHPRTLEAFGELAAYTVERGDIVTARRDLKRVLESASTAVEPELKPLAALYVLNGDLAAQDKDVIGAEESYTKALGLLEPLAAASRADRLSVLYKLRELNQSAGREEAAARAAERARALESELTAASAEPNGA